ncbi:MAG TPA: ABC transporter ATP-binding protein [Candidatus Sulfobium mesophilum]|nr:ABC transporter ATP-binding protein [Candidatus Sulfobium mesophilum]
MTTTAIEIAKLSKTFKITGRPAVEALKDVSFSVGAGEVFGFLGPNGAGKSTTIKILMGLIRPTSGRASLMGHDVQSYLSRKHVGYLPENPAFYDFLTAREYLMFVGKTFGMDSGSLPEKTDSVLKMLDLAEAGDRPLRGYSKGMVQRLGLAQALIHDPEVLILDEPMSGLDPVGRALVKETILELKAKGKCVFFSTHITSDVETVCDRVGIIVNGSLQRVEFVDSLLTMGIVGYHLRVRVPGTSKQKEIDVTKEELSRRMSEIHAAGEEITLIDPKRKNLEAFFLDIVREGKK